MTGDERRKTPTQSDEIASLLGFLNHHRDTLVAKARGLNDEQLRTRLEPSTITLGGLLGHLSFVEDHWFGWALLAKPREEPWRSLDFRTDREADWRWAASATGAQLLDLFREQTERSDTILEQALAGAGLDQLAQRDGWDMSLRWILLHMLEEYARHNGHADLIRESIDGAVGH